MSNDSTNNDNIFLKAVKIVADRYDLDENEILGMANIFSEEVNEVEEELNAQGSQSSPSSFN